MKVIRCKDCALQFRAECPMAIVEKRKLVFLNRSPMFFCAKGCHKDDYIPTNGDAIRSMTDRQLAEYLDGVETEVVKHERRGCKWNTGKTNIAFWVKFLGTAEGEDCE